jgi:hypothetical protein
MYIENDMFKTVSNEEIIHRFQNMKTQWEQLNKFHARREKINYMFLLYVL